MCGWVAIHMTKRSANSRATHATGRSADSGALLDLPDGVDVEACYVPHMTHSAAHFT